MSTVSMSKRETERMYQARVEIEKGNYVFALKTLKDITHPQARVWQAKIERRMQRENEVKQSKKQQTKNRLAVVVILIAVVVIGLAIYLATQQQQAMVTGVVHSLTGG